ncbi:hypothetical protein Ciccas_005665 [Cichlidogyrus casuarinus]|uniref:Dynein light chain n=1 Tax=Cichlidogyrus casuarinus TaxID=1844966 RepID=A0ABD2Q8Y7_9PLAT
MLSHYTRQTLKREPLARSAIKIMFRDQVTYENRNRHFGTISNEEEREALVKCTDMPLDMQQRAVDTAATALDKYEIEKDIAGYIKETFDRELGPTWHCVIGKNFGSFITHDKNHFIYFFIGAVGILLYKFG